MVALTPNSLNDNDRNSLKEIEATFDSNGNIKAQKNKSSIWPKLFSVIAAIALWLYVFQAVEYESVVKGVPIIIENFNSSLGLNIVSGYESTVDVTLSGTKSAINEISSSDIKASVDLTGVTKIGTHIVDIEIDVPGSSKIVDKSASQIKIVVDKTISKQIELVSAVNYNVQYPYELGETELSHSYVTLEGPEADIKSVEKAVVELNLGNVRNNIVSSAGITLYNSDNYEIQSKYIMMQPSTVEVSIPVYKTAMLNVKPELVIDSDKYEYRTEPAVLYIKGEVNDVDAFTQLKTAKAYVESAGEFTLPIIINSKVAAYPNYEANPEEKVDTVKVIITEKPVKQTRETDDTNEKQETDTLP